MTALSEPLYLRYLWQLEGDDLLVEPGRRPAGRSRRTAERTRGMELRLPSRYGGTPSLAREVGLGYKVIARGGRLVSTRQGVSQREALG